MRFQVPQFTDVQTKLIGPFTLQQFGWLVVGGLLFVFVQFFLEGTPLIIAICVIVAASLLFAYVRISNVSLAKYILMGIVFFFSQKKFTFVKEQDPNGQ